MKIHRFYIHNIDLVENIILEDKNQVNQITKVFRAQIGDTFSFFSKNKEAHYVVKGFNQNSISFTKIKDIESNIENCTNGRKVLCMSLIKSGFEEIVRAASEIGIDTIVPIITERSEKKDLNIERMQKIAIEASEQSGRMDILEIKNPIKLKDFLETKMDNVNIIFDTIVGENNIKIDTNLNVNLFIGPEGGWTNSEREIFKNNIKNNNCISVKLDTNILKAETAGIVGAFWLKNLQ